MLSLAEILESVLKSPTERPFRPNILHAMDNTKIAEQVRPITRLIETCWKEEPQNRPNAKYVLKTLNRI